MKVSVGVTTYNRPDYAKKSLRALSVLPSEVSLLVCNDGSDAKYNAEYCRLWKRFRDRWGIISGSENRGVAGAKNQLLKRMLDDGADWLFLCEDDILVNSSKAVTEYIRVAETNGLHHLSFAHHGGANGMGPVGVAEEVEFYHHSIGAWTLFSRESLERVGLFDEHFRNAWEHVEHEMRLIVAGLMPGAGPYYYPDAVGSAQWIREVPNALSKSVIRNQTGWAADIAKGLRYWATEKPDTFAMLFGPGTPLEVYARDMLDSPLAS